MWRNEAISKMESEKYFPIVVVGNKTDLRVNPNEKINSDDNIMDSIRISETDYGDNRNSCEKVEIWCREQGYGLVETSCKDGYGVEAAMFSIAALSLEGKRRGDTTKAVKNAISLKDQQNQKDRFQNNNSLKCCQ
jgi:hypothetical protein